jgi:hypothetical protein
MLRPTVQHGSAVAKQVGGEVGRYSKFLRIRRPGDYRCEPRFHYLSKDHFRAAGIQEKLVPERAALRAASGNSGPECR